MHPNSKQIFGQQLRNVQPLVLIVDNDQDNLLLASYVVQSMGMDSVATDNSGECLNLVYKLLPDVILLDIVMPNVNGIEITRIIKQDQSISHTPIIAVTGLTRPEDTTEMIAAGFNSYLCKPYLIEELESRVSSCLGRILV